MRPWLLMLAGLGIWALHFTGVYVVVSLQDLAWPEESGRWRLIAVLFTGLCAAMCAAALALALRYAADLAPGPHRFMGYLGAAGAALALTAVTWQGLAVLFA